MVWSCDSNMVAKRAYRMLPCENKIQKTTLRQHKNKNTKNKPNKKRIQPVCVRSIVLAHICSETRQWTSHRLHNGFVDKSPSEWAPDALLVNGSLLRKLQRHSQNTCHQIAVRPKLKTLTLRGSSGHSCRITPMVCTPPSRCTLETAW